MKTFKYLFVSTTFIGLSLIVLTPCKLFAQDIRKPQKITMEESSNFKLKYGVGLSTRYLWRGLDLAKAPTLEPYGIAQLNHFELSVYGVYGLYESAPKNQDFARLTDPTNFFAQRIAFTEVITNIYYNILAKFGTFRLGITDYHFPDQYIGYQVKDSTGAVTNYAYKIPRWLNWDGDGKGAHTLELNLEFTGTEKFPLWLLFAINVHNDPDNAVYLEAGYIFNLLQNKLTIWSGGTLGASRWYQFHYESNDPTKKLKPGNALTNFGIAFSREVYIQSWLVLNFSLQDIIDFYEERNTILFTTILKIE